VHRTIPLPRPRAQLRRVPRKEPHGWPRRALSFSQIRTPRVALVADAGRSLARAVGGELVEPLDDCAVTRHAGRLADATDTDDADHRELAEQVRKRGADRARHLLFGPGALGHNSSLARTGKSLPACSDGKDRLTFVGRSSTFGEFSAFVPVVAILLNSFHGSYLSCSSTGGLSSASSTRGQARSA